MDDEAVFGPVLHRLSFGEAIERDLLSDYQVVVVGVDDETYRAYAERGEFVTRDGKKITDARTLAGQIGLAKTMRKYDLRRVISFHGRVKAAREFSAEMPDVIAWMPPQARPAGALWSEHVSGAMTSGHRDRLLLRFRDLAPKERGLLSNARCLGEGVDVPSIDGVAFIDPRRSTIDIVQALGRAIRKSPDKKLGTIVLPVFLSDEEDPEQVLDESAFKHVWDVLKALRAHDEALGEELDELRRRLGARRSPPRLPGKIKLDVPVERVGARVRPSLQCPPRRADDRVVGVLLRAAAAIRRARGAHPRPAGPPRGRLPARGWVNRQRQASRKGELVRGASGASSAAGWVWDRARGGWEEGFAQLRRGSSSARDMRWSRRLYHRRRVPTWRVGQCPAHRIHRQAKLDSARRRLEAVPAGPGMCRSGMGGGLRPPPQVRRAQGARESSTRDSRGRLQARRVGRRSATGIPGGNARPAAPGAAGGAAGLDLGCERSGLGGRLRPPAEVRRARGTLTGAG